MSVRLLVALDDLEDAPGNRSALNWGSWVAAQGHEVHVLAAHGGPLQPMAEEVGRLVVTDWVNDWRPARLLARARLGPIAQVLKSRRVRRMAQPAGTARGVLVAGPGALPLLDWLPSGARRVAVVVTGADLPVEGPVRAALAGADVLVADANAAEAVADAGPPVVEAGPMIERPAVPAPSPSLVAVAGLAEGDLERFVDLARAVRRAVPGALVGWVRDDEGGDGSQWSWTIHTRGDLADLAGAVVGIPADGSHAVSGVLVAGDRHPLVPVAASVAGVPCIEVGAGEDAGVLVGLADALRAGSEPEADVLDRHVVDRAGRRVLTALEGG